MPDLSKSTIRANLPRQHHPHWHRLSRGCSIGLRRDATDTWYAAHRPPHGTREIRALGEFATYEEAKAVAEAWFESRGVRSGRVLTVEEAGRHYITTIRATKPADRVTKAEGYLRRRVYGTEFGRTPLDDRLQPLAVRGWRDRLLEIETKQSANRDLKQLRAALNQAFRDGLATSRAKEAWDGISGFDEPNGDGVRINFLPLAARRKIIKAAPAGAVRDFFVALMFTAARPIELRRAVVADLHPAQHLIVLASFKGRGAKRRIREVTLSDAALAHFKQRAQGKAPTDLLFTKADGTAWSDVEVSRAFAGIRDKAGLPPATVAYDLRHTAIVEWLRAGIDPGTVSKLAGTGLAVISKHYLKLVHSHARAGLNKVVAL